MSRTLFVFVSIRKLSFAFHTGPPSQRGASSHELMSYQIFAQAMLTRPVWFQSGLPRDSERLPREQEHSFARRVVRRPSTIRITSLSPSIIIAGGSTWLKASRSMTIWKSGLPKVRSSLCPPLPLKVTLMVHRTRTRVPMPRNSRADMHAGPSRLA